MRELDLPKGFYEIEFSVEIPTFPVDSLYFDWRGTRTGPWDYSWLPGNEGQLLLPYAELSINGQHRGGARMVIPRADELERKEFRSIIGFSLDHDGPVRLELIVAKYDVIWKNFAIHRMANMLAPADVKEFHVQNAKFWLPNETLSSVKQRWDRAPWGKHLDWALERFEHLQAPHSLAERKALAPEIAKVIPDSDCCIFPGQYLSALCLRHQVKGRDGDWQQILRWVDGLIALEFWGKDADKDGRDHNNDLTAAFDMLGLVTAVNWYGGKLGQDRYRAALKKIRYQVDQMVQWIITARSSWPRTAAQNHAYYGYQTVLLGSLALLEHEPIAAEWLGLALRGFKAFLAELPADGTYGEGMGYENFALLGLLPSLMLLEQLTDQPWVPRDWIGKHVQVALDLLPPKAKPGFSIGDGDNSNPIFLPLLAWVLQHMPADSLAATSTKTLLQHLNSDGFDIYERGWMFIWPALWGNEISDDPSPLGKASRPAQSLAVHRDSGHCLFGLSEQSKAYFLAGPPGGHRLCRREFHPYAFGHHHPEAGAVLLNVAGQWVLTDTGYTYRKASSDHNVLTIGGQGQHNDGWVWMTEPPPGFNPPEVIVSEHKEYSEAWLDLAAYYPRRLGLVSWVRRVLAVYQMGLIVVDDVVCERPAKLAIRWLSEQPWQATTLKDCSAYRMNLHQHSNAFFVPIGTSGSIRMTTIEPPKPQAAAARRFFGLELEAEKCAHQVWTSAFLLPGITDLPTINAGIMEWRNVRIP